MMVGVGSEEGHVRLLNGDRQVFPLGPAGDFQQVTVELPVNFVEINSRLED